MKNAYIKMLVDRCNYRSIEVCARAQTKEMCGDMTIAFLGCPSGEMVPATGLDLILYGNNDTWPSFVKVSKEITLEEAINTMMPSFYRIVYNEAQRDPALCYIMPKHVVKLMGLDRKIRACAQIKCTERIQAKGNKQKGTPVHEHGKIVKESTQKDQELASTAPATYK